MAFRSQCEKKYATIFNIRDVRPLRSKTDTGRECSDCKAMFYITERRRAGMAIWTESLYSCGADYYYAVPCVAKEKSFVAGSKCTSSVLSVTSSMNVKRDTLAERWHLI